MTRLTSSLSKLSGPTTAHRIHWAISGLVLNSRGDGSPTREVQRIFW